MVVRDEEDMQAQLGKLRDAFEASDLPIKVDLSEWNQLPDWLKRDILEEHVLLQEPTKTSILNGRFKNINLVLSSLKTKSC